MSAFSFDAAFREAKKVGAEFVLYGETFTLPASLPVGAVLEVQRLQRADQGEEANVVELFDRVYGACRGPDEAPGYIDIHKVYHPGTLTQRWIDSGLTVDQMTEMLRWAFSQYGSAKADPTAAPKRGKASLTKSS